MNRNLKAFIFATLAIIIVLSIIKQNTSHSGSNDATLQNNSTNSSGGTKKSAPTKTSSTPSPKSTPNVAKTSTNEKTKTPTPEPVNSWWPEYFSPWGATIAFQYHHDFTQGCTTPGHISGCYGNHYLQIRVIEPCSTMAIDVLDDDGTTYVAYLSSYVSTGQTFNTSVGDAHSPTSPGRVTNITCNP